MINRKKKKQKKKERALIDVPQLISSGTEPNSKKIIPLDSKP